jgi:hypothetical protein
MKDFQESTSAGDKTPVIHSEANKIRTRRLEIQKEVIMKIMDPLTEQVTKDTLKEDWTKRTKK